MMTRNEEERMRLWTAMLGAWLAAGTGAAETVKGADRARPEAATQPRPVAECCLEGNDRRAEAAAPAAPTHGSTRQG
jgi:hypothetical protein